MFHLISYGTQTMLFIIFMLNCSVQSSTVDYYNTGVSTLRLCHTKL